MNQSNMQNNQVRQVSPEEIQRVSQGKQFQETQLTPEELQRTQVLNLQEVEKVAHFEKITSKKPAIILAIIGVLLLVCGTTVQILGTISTNNKVDKKTVQKRESTDNTKLQNKKDKLNCTLTNLNNSDGTDITFNVIYNFKNEKLANFEKHFKVVPTSGNPTGMETIKEYANCYNTYFMLTNLTGYNIKVTPKADNTEITCDVAVNLETINLTQYPASQQNHFSTSIDYALYTDYDTIRNELELKNFKCE